MTSPPGPPPPTRSARDAAPALLSLGLPRALRAGVLVLHGGRSESAAPARRTSLAALRMYPFLLDLRRAGRRHGLGVWQLRPRTLGYNDGEALEDAAWALDRLAEQLGGRPLALVGHSMGARIALHLAAHDAVTSIAGLAPWVPPGEPVEQLAGRDVLLVHGRLDRVTNPAHTRLYAARAERVARRLALIELRRGEHTMLVNGLSWQRLARSFVLGTLGLEPLDERLDAAFRARPAAAGGLA